MEMSTWNFGKICCTSLILVALIFLVTLTVGLQNFFLYDKYGSQVYGGVSTKTELTSEILKVPFVVECNGKVANYEFLTGFFGITQDQKNASIKPVIGWAVR